MAKTNAQKMDSQFLHQKQLIFVTKHLANPKKKKKKKLSNAGSHTGKENGCFPLNFTD